MKFKQGSEYLYRPNSNLDPVCLVYIEELKNGLHRFFASSNASLDYHVHEGCVEELDGYDRPEITEKYLCFSGEPESSKEIAYYRFLKVRGVSLD